MNKRSYHKFFNNFANPLKIDIIFSLKNKGRSVNELIKELNIEQSRLSHALQGLRKCGIVQVFDNGRERIYSLNEKYILPMIELLDNHAKEHCGGVCLNNQKCWEIKKST